jgi:hypothetical protein
VRHLDGRECLEKPAAATITVVTAFRVDDQFRAFS